MDKNRKRANSENIYDALRLLSQGISTVARVPTSRDKR